MGCSVLVTVGKNTMKITLVVATLFLLSCTYFKHELSHAGQRSEAKKYDDYLPWSEAEAGIVERCDKIRSVYQGHNRVVVISFDEDASITTISPEIDQVLEVIRDCRGSYDGISIIME